MCQTLSKALDISSATAQAAPDLLKPLAVLLDKTVRRSALVREDLKPYWKSENKGQLSRDNQQAAIFKFLKYFTNHRKKTDRAVVFSCTPLPDIIKYRNHR